MNNYKLSRIILTILFIIVSSILVIVNNTSFNVIIHSVIFYLYLLFNTFLCKKIIKLSEKFNKLVYYLLMLPAGLLVIGFLLYLITSFIFSKIPVDNFGSGIGIVILFILVIIVILFIIILPFIQTMLLLLLNKLRKNK